MPLRRAWQPTLKHACLENPIDRGAWQATVHGVAKSQIQLKWLSRDRHAHLMRTAVKNPGIFSPCFPFLQYAYLLNQKGWFWLQGPNLWTSVFPQTLVGGWFWDDSNTLHFCSLCSYYYISSTSDHQVLDLTGGWGPLLDICLILPSKKTTFLSTHPHVRSCPWTHRRKPLWSTWLSILAVLEELHPSLCCYFPFPKRKHVMDSG